MADIRASVTPSEKATSVTVALGDRSYPIQIGAQLIDRSEALKALAHNRQVAIVSNSTVAPLYGARIRDSIKTDAAQVLDIVLPDGEIHKDWPALNTVFEALLNHRFDRQCLVIAVGGGVVGDVAGFAAALYQRGVEFVQVPTTLLAQVDSSVGGKTAINHALGKNMIGAFHQPRLVIADVETLRTLAPRELSAGLAEVIKHGLVADPAYLDQVEADMAALRALDHEALVRAVAGSCRIKASIVARDERESGLRAILNFGHTFGHAIESGMGYGQWLHGEAVGCGMVMAAQLSLRLGMIDNELAARVRRLVQSAGLPVRGPAWAPERYLELMEVDKKAQQGTPRFVLLQSLGQATLQRVPRSELFAALRDCGAH